MTTKTNKLAALAVLLGGGVLFAACSSDSNDTNPTPVVQPDVDSGSPSGGSNAGGKSNGGATNGGAPNGGKPNGGAPSGGAGTGGGGGATNTGGSGDTDGGNQADTGTGTGGAGGDGGTPTGSCTLNATKMCVECTFDAKPTTDTQFLNQCTNNACIPFDNAANSVPTQANLPALP